MEFKRIKLSDLSWTPAPDSLAFLPTIDGTTFGLSRRFLDTALWNAKIDHSHFRVFSPDEVMSRLVDKYGDQEFRMYTEGKDALSLVPHDAPVYESEALLDLAESIGATYSVYGPVAEIRMAKHATKIALEEYTSGFSLKVHLDSYANPNISPFMERLVCSNGMVAQAAIYTSELRVFSDPMMILNKAVANFSGDKHLHKIVEKIDKARNAYASVEEVYGIIKADPNNLGIITEAVHGMSGGKMGFEVQSLLSSVTGTAKRRRQVQMNFTLYELLQMSTELSTHYSPDNARLKAAISGFLIRDPDIEGSAQGVSRSIPDFVLPRVA